MGCSPGSLGSRLVCCPSSLVPAFLGLSVSVSGLGVGCPALLALVLFWGCLVGASALVPSGGLVGSPGGSVGFAGPACSSCGACSVALSASGLCWACAPRCSSCFRPVGFSGRGACSCPPPAPPLPLFRSVARSAFRAGSLASVARRPASWSAAVLVGVFGFRSSARAGAFASRWASRLGVSVRVRRSAGLWVVAVPVAGVPSGSRAGLWVSGGLRGFVRVLALLASASPSRLRLAGGVASGV